MSWQAEGEPLEVDESAPLDPLELLPIPETEEEERALVRAYASGLLDEDEPDLDDIVAVLSVGAAVTRVRRIAVDGPRRAERLITVPDSLVADSRP